MIKNYFGDKNISNVFLMKALHWGNIFIANPTSCNLNNMFCCDNNWYFNDHWVR